MSIIQDMAGNILETRFQDLDDVTIKQAKWRIIDVIGCMLGGAHASGCKVIADLVRKWGGAPESTIPVYGFKAPAHQAALVNSIMCRSFDFEPVGPYVHGANIPAHVSGTTVPVALAVAEQHAASGRELITALVVGDDMTSRVLAASSYFFDVGWDGTGTVNAFGATAIAGRIIKLSREQLVNAFGIGLNHMAGSFQNIYDGAHCFKLPMGLAARAGIFAAELAGQGFTGPNDPLESKNGYFRLYCQSYDPEIMSRDLGTKFFADATFKPYSACRSTHGVIDCSLRLVGQYDIDPDNIEAITIDVTEATRNMFVGQPFIIRHTPQIDATFSLRYNAANVLLRRSVRLEHFSEEAVRDEGIAKLVSKVKIIATLPPQPHLATRLEVRTKDGQTLSAAVENPRGDIYDNPMSEGELRDKFRTNAAFSGALSPSRIEEALARLESLEEVDDFNEIIKLIA